MLLNNLSVLVTRPQGQADTLMAAIDAAGGKAVHCPVMDIVALTDKVQLQQCKQKIMVLDEFQQVIFISGNAVNFGMAWVHQYWPQLPVGIDWHGIGKKTVAQLIDQGVPCQPYKPQGAMNSEALLQHKSLQQLAGQKVLIVRGIGGRDYLAQQLTKRGAQVSYAECYKRVVPVLADGELQQIIQQQAINTVCLNSGESAANFSRLLGGKGLNKITVVVPGDRVAAIADELGFKHIITAESASDQSMLDALKRI